MGDTRKRCVNCRYDNKFPDEWPCVDCLDHDRWEEYISDTAKKVLLKWLSSFDTDSATKCFEAVNLLKQRLEGER